MKAGRLSYFLTPQKLEVLEDPVTGETKRVWRDQPEIRAERVKFISKAVTRGGESFFDADAVFRIRWTHRIEDGWRVQERGGFLYDVTVEPDRENDMRLLKCTKVND